MRHHKHPYAYTTFSLHNIALWDQIDKYLIWVQINLHFWFKDQFWYHFVDPHLGPFMQLLVLATWKSLAQPRVFFWEDNAESYVAFEVPMEGWQVAWGSAGRCLEERLLLLARGDAFFWRGSAFQVGLFPLERRLQRSFWGEELLFGYLEKREGRTRELEFSLGEWGRRGRGELPLPW